MCYTWTAKNHSPQNKKKDVKVPRLQLAVWLVWASNVTIVRQMYVIFMAWATINFLTQPTKYKTANAWSSAFVLIPAPGASARTETWHWFEACTFIYSIRNP